SLDLVDGSQVVDYQTVFTGLPRPLPDAAPAMRKLGSLDLVDGSQVVDYQTVFTGLPRPLPDAAPAMR
ncbi:hypothetical protein VS878_22350, partial [Salmonella enterica subsp. enterica serovar Paratyphi A]|nr:hypothetical protein [Salmonella enterica subsp. enterica serovar Paratyphi A]